MHPGEVLSNITATNPADPSGTAQELSSQLTALLQTIQPATGNTTTTCTPNTGPTAGTYTCILRSADGSALDAIVVSVTSIGQVTFVADLGQDIRTGASGASSTASSTATTSSPTSPSSSSVDCGPYDVPGGQVSHYTDITAAGASCGTARAVAKWVDNGVPGSSRGPAVTEGWGCSHPSDGSQLEAQCNNGSAEVNLYANPNSY
jgi:hypothetical protein